MAIIWVWSQCSTNRKQIYPGTGPNSLELIQMWYSYLENFLYFKEEQRCNLDEDTRASEGKVNNLPLLSLSFYVGHPFYGTAHARETDTFVL